MRLKNDATHFGLIAILLHWIIAVLIIGLLCVGLYMVELPISPSKLKIYGIHKATGLLVLALVVVRLCWRVINTTPKLAMPLWEVVIARIVHWAFYVLMLAMPITGWLLTSSAGLAPSFYGLFTVPTLIAPNENLRPLFANMHQWIAFALIATILLHVAAALKHHFYDKDEILKRMIS